MSGERGVMGFMLMLHETMLSPALPRTSSRVPSISSLGSGLLETADSAVPQEPGCGLLCVCCYAGSEAREGNQMGQKCILRAWPDDMQATKHALIYVP